MAGELEAEAERAKYVARLNQGFAQAVPHNRALALRFIGYDKGVARILLPYAAHLVGNPGTGVLHGGVIPMLGVPGRQRARRGVAGRPRSPHRQRLRVLPDQAR